jgi:phytanoyl-CoA hydroxylase
MDGDGHALRPLTGGEIERAIASYREVGYARLGKIVPEARLAPLRARIDAIMMGKITYDGLFFQRDAGSGRYDDLVYGQGWEGPGLDYRKVEKLEKDPLFRAYLADETFREITSRVIGPEITLYRACVFAKSAATGGSDLPWHQDGGKFWGLDREPTLQIWTALDDAPVDGGCVEIVPGSHANGLATPLGGVVPADVLARGEIPRAELLPAEAGEVLLIHNHAWHRSARGKPGAPRRALTVAYMDAATRCLRTKRAPREFFRVFSASGATSAGTPGSS